MARLVNADALAFAFLSAQYETDIMKELTAERVANTIISLSREMDNYTPVVHAHKVRAHSQGGGTHWVVCSHCEQPIDWQDAYCKHCGAIMDEEVE